MTEAGRRFKAREREKESERERERERERETEVKLISKIINTAFEDYVSSKSTFILSWFCVANEDKTQSTSSRIVEKIEVIQKYFYHSRKKKLNFLFPIYVFAC